MTAKDPLEEKKHRKLLWYVAGAVVVTFTYNISFHNSCGRSHEGVSKKQKSGAAYAAALGPVDFTVRPIFQVAEAEGKIDNGGSLDSVAARIPYKFGQAAPVTFYATVDDEVSELISPPLIASKPGDIVMAFANYQNGGKLDLIVAGRMAIQPDVVGVYVYENLANKTYHDPEFIEAISTGPFMKPYALGWIPQNDYNPSAGKTLELEVSSNMSKLPTIKVFESGNLSREEIGRLVCGESGAYGLE